MDIHGYKKKHVDCYHTNFGMNCNRFFENCKQNIDFDRPDSQYPSIWICYLSLRNLGAVHNKSLEDHCIYSMF
jgi:hypothetical protein